MLSRKESKYPPYRRLALIEVRGRDEERLMAFAGRLKDRIAEEFGRIECPTLLIWGDRDHRSLQEDQYALLREIQGAQLKIYPGCGHLVHIEEPRRFALDIAAFWEETVATGTS